MNRKTRKVQVLALAVFSLAGVMLFAGCEGKPTSAASNTEKHVGPPPVVQAAFVSQEAASADPLMAPVWTTATWHQLTAPQNTGLTTPPVRAAMLYDARNLYVAFVAATVPPPASPIGQDFLSVYLDSSNLLERMEAAQISIDNTGRCGCTWIRSGSTARAREDGSPDTAHPLDRLPNWPVKELAGVVRQATENGASVWTAVVTIPLKNLPQPLRQSPVGGEKWKVNLLRTVVTVDAGRGSQQLQANLSPVYVGAQGVSPFRMATVELTPAK